MFWRDIEKRQIAGHMPNPPKIGDQIVVPMISGNNAAFTVIEVEVMTDPSDQFFATLSQEFTYQ